MTSGLSRSQVTLRELAVGLRLLQRRLELGERRLGLRDLVIELGRDDLRQQLRPP